MSRPSALLDRLHITQPCNARWEEMRGNESVRFCEHCSLSVQNISQMTRKDVLRLVKRSEGRLCVRFVRRPDGGVQTKGARLHQISRRASRFVAGAFTAALSLSGAAVAAQTAQTSTTGLAAANAFRSVRSNSVPASPSDVVLDGNVVDPVEAVIPGARVVLQNRLTLAERITYTDDEGKFSFHSMEKGSYKLKVEHAGFTPFEEELAVDEQTGSSLSRTITLDVQMHTVTTGGAMLLAAENPLVRAASENDLDALKEQLQLGIDVNTVDKEIEVTALIEAVNHGNVEMIKVLLAVGADVNQQMADEKTALMYLDEDASAELVRRLIAAGAEVNHADAQGNTALMMAAINCNVESLQALIDAGAKLEARNDEGRTALMLAVLNAEPDNIKRLIDAGADVHQEDDEGKTALAIAEENEAEELAELLRAHGASR